MNLCFHLGIYLAVELLDFMVALRLLSEELPDCFAKWPHHFTFLPAGYEGSNFSSSHQRVLLPIFFIIVILVDVKATIIFHCIYNSVYLNLSQILNTTYNLVLFYLILKGNSMSLKTIFFWEKMSKYAPLYSITRNLQQT